MPLHRLMSFPALLVFTATATHADLTITLTTRSAILLPKGSVAAPMKIPQTVVKIFVSGSHKRVDTRLFSILYDARTHKAFELFPSTRTFVPLPAKQAWAMLAEKTGMTGVTQGFPASIHLRDIHQVRTFQGFPCHGFQIRLEGMPGSCSYWISRVRPTLSPGPLEQDASQLFLSPFREQPGIILQETVTMGDAATGQTTTVNSFQFSQAPLPGAVFQIPAKYKLTEQPEPFPEIVPKSLHPSQNKTLVDAANDHDIDTVRKLLRTGADVNGVAPDGETALMAAADTRDLAIVQALLDAGADVNKTKSPADAALPHDRSTGYTALIYAADAGDPQIVRLLLAKGADVTVKTPSAITALSAARPYPVIIAMLQAAGAKE